MSFLKAEWRKLAIANYEINPEVLQEYLPYGTELDLWEGKCYVSLVGFMFVNTKVLGVRIPFHVNFEEVNLRFYVKRKENNEWKRGVVFIKEIVPKRAITCVANTVYKENYETLKMNHIWEENDNQRVVEYKWEKYGNWNYFRINAELNLSEIPENSEVEFITEHYWGYAKVNEQKTNEYEVTHVKWKQYKVINFDIKLDFGNVYGAKFSFINDLEPVSVMLAEGSKISVENKTTISY